MHNIYMFILEKPQNAHFIPVNQRLPCTLGSKLPTGTHYVPEYPSGIPVPSTGVSTGTPVFKRGMNASGVFEDAHFISVHIYAPASSGTSSLRMIPTFFNGGCSSDK